MLYYKFIGIQGLINKFELNLDTMVWLYLTAMTFPSDKSIPRNCAMKIAATASYKAVPENTK